MNEPNTTRDHIAMIQALRGFAAMCIVVTHAIIEVNWTGSTASTSMQPGEFGVDVFFVISGFIMVAVSRDMFGHKGAPLAFFPKRLIRIVPLYWILSLALITLIFIAPEWINDPRIDFTYWMKSLLFIPAEHPASGALRPVLVVGWTLQYEMMFYLLFAFSLLFSRKAALAGLLLVLSGVVLAGQVFAPENAIMKFFSSPIILEFAFGIGIGWLYVRNFRLSSSMVWIFPLLVAVLLFLGWYFTLQHSLGRVILFGIPAALLVTGATLPVGVGSIQISRFWENLGDSSYALYLSHVFVITAFGLLADIAGPALWRENQVLGFAFILLAMVSSYYGGLWLHKWIEKPIGISLRKFAGIKKPAAKAGDLLAKPVGQSPIS